MSSLLIGDHTMTGLKAAAEQERLEEIVQHALAAAATGRTDTQFKVSGAAAKSAFAGILTLVLEAARNDASASDITPILEQAGWPSSASQQLSQQYAAQKDALRLGSSAAIAVAAASAGGSSAALAPPLASLSSTAFPSVVGVSWRVDDFLRSDVLDGVRQPAFLLELQAQTPLTAEERAQGKEGVHTIPFACNFQQMQDLLAKLKDAQKQIQQRVE